MKIYLVGGAVRDQLLGVPIIEKDWVVVGGTVEEMLAQGYRQVGKEFPVFLHPDTHEEYALARLERKTQPGYKGFVFDTSPEVALEDDLARRDLTINAMARTRKGKLIDLYGGEKDLEQKILRHVSPAFAEDPVRILRVGRFWARYAHLGFKVAPETLALMQQMVTSGEVNALVAERVWKEMERALTERNPEKFFELLSRCGALKILMPHLKINGPGIKALINASRLTPHNHSSSLIRFAALLHAHPEDNKQIASLSFKDFLQHFKAANNTTSSTSNESHLIEAKKTITFFCDRYRVPTTYKTLAILSALHYASALNAQTLSPEALLSLFTALDIFRRKERFQQFLLVCEAIAPEDFNREWLSKCAATTDSVDIQALLGDGFTGEALAAQIKQSRLKKIKEFINFTNQAEF